MRRKVALGAVALGLVAVIVALVLVRGTVQRLATAEITRLLEEGEWGRITYSSLKVDMHFGITLGDPAFYPKGYSEPLLTASEARVSVSLWDVLRRKESVAAAIALRNPRFKVTYEGKGKFDVSALAERALREAPAKLPFRRLSMDVAGGEVHIALADDARRELADELSERGRQWDELLSGVLESASSRLGVEWSDELRQSLRDRLSASIPQLPESVTVEFGGSASYEPQESLFTGRLRLKNPLQANLAIRASRKGDITLSASNMRIRVADLPLLWQSPSVLSLSETGVEIPRLTLERAESGVAKLAVKVNANDVVVLPRMTNPLSVSRFEFEYDDGDSRASVKGGSGEASFSGEWMSANDGELRVRITDLPPAGIVSSIRGVSASGLSLRLDAKSLRGKTPRFDGDITLSEVTYRGHLIADGVQLEGSYGSNYDFSLNASRGARTLVKLHGNGAGRQGEFSAQVNLSRSDLRPGILPSGSPALVVNSLSGGVSGGFDFDRRQVAFTLARARLSASEYELTASRGTGTFVWVKNGESTKLSLTATLLSSSLNAGNVELALPALGISASRESFVVIAGDALARLTEPPEVSAKWRKWLPESLRAELKVTGKATAAGWRLEASSSGGSLTGPSGKLTASVALSGILPSVSGSATVAGLLDDRPLVVKLSGSFDGKTLKLEDSTAAYGTARLGLLGDVDYGTKRLSLGYEASELELSSLAPDWGIEGKVNSSGRVSGTFAHPSVSGTMQIPSLQAEAGSLPLELNKVATGFSYDDGIVELRGGSLLLAGQLVFVEGAISAGGVNLSVWKERLSPGRIVAGLMPEAPLDWRGSGKFSARIEGALDDIRYSGSYEQSEGSLNGVALDELGIRVHGDMRTLVLEESTLRASGASLALAGSVALATEGDATWEMHMIDFPVKALASSSYLGERLGLDGRVQGVLRGQGEWQRPKLSGTVEVTDARLLDTPFTRIRLAFSSAVDGVKIDEFTAESEESSVYASGFWGYRPEDTLINLEVPLLDLSLFSPLMPPDYGSLTGELGATVLVTETAQGEPELAGTFQSSSAEGIRLGPIQIDRAQGRLSYRRGVLELYETTLTANGSRLSLMGKLPMPGSDQPLDIHVSTSDFALVALRSLIPIEGLDLGGTVSSEVFVTGTWERPLVSGYADAHAENLSYRQRFTVPVLTARIEVQDNQMKSVQGVAFLSSGDDDEGGRAPEENSVAFEGSGFYNFTRKDFDSLNVSLDLSRSPRLQFGALLDAVVDGTLSLARERPTEPYLLSGQLAVHKGAILKASDLPRVSGQMPSQPTKLALDVEVEPSATVRYPPMALEGRVFGKLHIGGELAKPELSGEMTASSGSLMIYRHIVRLVEPATITFSPAYELIPFVQGKAALELPGILTSVSFSPETGGGIYLPTGVQGQGQSLTIYFHLNALLTPDSLNSIELSSDPPLPHETILSYLIGGPQGQLTRTGFESFLQTEALLYSSSRLSRFLEESLDLKRFQLWTQDSREGTPLYVNVEKQLTPSLSASYLRSFFTTFDERQEFAAKYLLYKKFDYKGYLELMQRYRGASQEEFAANLVLNIKF